MSTTTATPTDASHPHGPGRPGPLHPHRTDLVALVFGLAFLAIGMISLGHQLDWFGGDDADYGGIMLAVIGAIGVLAVLAAGLRRSKHTEPAVTEPAVIEPAVIEPVVTEPALTETDQAITSTPDEATES
jgi:hypothetical protein